MARNTKIPKPSKMRTEIVTDLIRYTLSTCKYTSEESPLKRERDKAEERILALCLICQAAGMQSEFEQIKKEIYL